MNNLDEIVVNIFMCLYDADVDNSIIRYVPGYVTYELCFVNAGLCDL